MEKTSIVVLTGAGASKPLGLPLMKDFIKANYWQQQADTWFTSVAFMADQWSRLNTGYSDFEYIYTLAHVLADLKSDDPLAYALTGNSQINVPVVGTVGLGVDGVRKGAVALREYLRRHTHETLQNIDPEKAAKIYGEFLRPLIDRLPEVPSLSIFTTNYDRVVESVWEHRHQVKAFGRAVSLRRGFVNSDQYSTGPVWTPSDLDLLAPIDEPTVRLFKLHGSLNWRKTPLGVFETAADEYALNRSVVIYPLKDTKLYLEPPFDKLFDAWKAVVGTATDCIVVGSSLRDPQLVEPMVKATNQNSQLKIWLVDPAAEHIRAKLPDGLKSRCVAVPVPFGHPDLGVALSETIFDESKREAGLFRPLAHWGEQSTPLGANGPAGATP